MARIISDDGKTDVYIPDEYLHDGRRRLESTINIATQFTNIEKYQRKEAIESEVKNIHVDPVALHLWALENHPRNIYKRELFDELEQLCEDLGIEYDPSIEEDEDD